MKPKQLTWLAVCLIFASCIVISCGDDDNESPTDSMPAPTLTGKWVVVSGNMATQINFNVDKTVDLLYQSDFGVRSFESYVYLLTESQVIFGYYIYNYLKSADTLRLIRVADTTVLARDDAAPSLDEWAEPITIITDFDAPVNRAVDIAWHNDRLWFGNSYASDYLYKIDVSSGNVTDSLNTGRWAWGICWAGDDLWVSSDGSEYIYRIDTITGNTLQASVSMGAWINGIAFDGQYLWTGSHNESTIYCYDPAMSAVVDTFFVGRAVEGMTFYNGFLYACVNGIINKIQMSPFQVVAAFRIEGSFIEGITHDGTNFWLAVQHDNLATVAAASL